MYCDICWRYRNFNARMIPWSKGWTSDVRFGGRDFTFTLLIIFVTQWLVALTTGSKIFRFCLLITWFRSSSNASKIACVIHAFLFEFQRTGRCLVSVRCSLNAQGRAALPMTRGFNFSPVALQQKRTLHPSLESFRPLHFSPFWIKPFLGICRYNNTVSSALNWSDRGYSFITWCSFDFQSSNVADSSDRGRKLMLCRVLNDSTHPLLAWKCSTRSLCAVSLAFA
jgi:hypothetical protein